MSAALYILSGFCIVYFIVLSISAKRTSFSLGFMWPVAFSVYLACGLLADLASIYIPGTAVLIITAVFVIFCLVLFVVIINAYSVKKDGKPVYVIVLGAHVNGNVVSNILKRRLDRAFEVHEQFPGAGIIVTGARGTGEYVTEAHAMSVYLAGRGVPEDLIIEEDRSVSTGTNLSNSFEITGGTCPVGIVTSNFHIYRAVKMAEKTGFKEVIPYASDCAKSGWLHNMIRECFAVARYKVSGRI